ncbi:ion channel [Bacillaceae bacterium W0354]
MNVFVILLVIVIVVFSIYIFTTSTNVQSAFSKELFGAFLVIYFILMLGFSLVYYLMADMGFAVLADQTLQVGPPYERLFQSFYFSGVTLMTVGYGDLTPIGVARFVALAEASIGYLLPAAFLYKLIKN